MTEEQGDFIIVGQGLAGTTLGLHLQGAGQRVLMIDAQQPVTCSVIAAGLMTPMTGRRFALAWRCDETFATARDFYKRLEDETDGRFFHERLSVRLFKSAEERAVWTKRREQPGVQPYLVEPAPDPLIDPALGDARHGGFAMHAAQLDVPAFLAASRAILPSVSMSVDWTRDVVFDGNGVSVCGHRARRVISCEGHRAAHNAYFSEVRFNSTKGEVLTARFERPMPDRVLTRGVWVAPTTDPGVFRVGATYDRQSLDSVPTASARSEMERELQAFLHVPYSVLDHQAAVRPIIYQSGPLVGLHPDQDRLGFFNGLASKGALFAPWCAARFRDHLIDGIALPSDIDLQTWL